MGGSWTESGGSFSAQAGTVTFGGTGTMAASSFFDLTVNSGGTLTLGAALDVGGDLTLTAGTLSTGAFSLAVGGNALLTGALDASGQTGAQTTTVGGSMSGAGSFTMANGTATPDVDIDGAVSVATFTASAGQVNIGGNFTSPTFNAAGGTVLLDTAGSSTVTVTSYANLIIADTISMGAGWTVSGNLTVNGGFSLTTGAFSLAVGGNALLTGALDASGQTGAQTTTVGGSMSGAGSFTMANGTATPDVDIDGAVSVATFTASAGQVNIGGNFTSPTFNAAGGTVLLDTTAGSTISPGGSFANLTVAANKSLAGAVTVSDDLSVTAGTLSTGAFSLAVGGNALLTGALDASGQTGAQTTTVGGSMSGAGSFTMANGTATPDVDIDGAVSVATFTASAGQVNIGGNFTSPTFNAAGGTVVFDGAGDCDGKTFHNLTLSRAAPAPPAAPGR